MQRRKLEKKRKRCQIDEKYTSFSIGSPCQRTEHSDDQYSMSRSGEEQNELLLGLKIGGGGVQEQRWGVGAYYETNPHITKT